MLFLYPSFLWALSLISIPVIIHLFNFRRYKTVFFSNVKFLKSVKEQTNSRSQLKHFLILLCRVFALALLVFAFAQPFITLKNTSVNKIGKAVSIYIDNSFSMSNTTGDLPLIEQAKIKAREIVNGYGEGDKFQLITNDFEGKHQRLISKEQMLDWIDGVHISPEVRKLSDVVKRQKQALSEEAGSSKVIYDISDFQKSMADIQDLPQDTTVKINLVPLAVTQLRNLFIDSCWAAAPLQIEGRTTHLFVKITNASDADVEKSRLTLRVNNEVKAINEFSVAPNASIIDTIGFTVAQTGWNNGLVQISDYPITFDDNYYIAFNAVDKINVMVINGTSENIFLSALFHSGDIFNEQSTDAGKLNYSDLGKNNLVVLNEISSISSGLADELKKYLQQGGNVLVFPDLHADVDSYNKFLSEINAPSLGTYNTDKKAVTRLDTKNELLKDLFRTVSENMKLPYANASFSLDHTSSSLEEVVLQFNDGSPLISGCRVGAGNLYLCTTPLQKDITDLPISPIFAPLVYKMAITGNAVHPLAYVIGQYQYQQIVLSDTNNTSGDIVYHMKNNNTEFIPKQRKIGISTLINPMENVKQDGIYSVFLPGHVPAMLAALNYDRTQSVMQFADVKSEISNKSHIAIINGQTKNLTLMVQEMNAGIILWKVCIIFVLIFLAIETLLIKFWK
jgi:hypothetical protein